MFKKPKISLPKKQGCKEREKLGNTNNIPFWVFMSAVMSRAVYQYDGLFQHLIKSYFNNKFILEQFTKLKDTNKVNLYEPKLVDAGAPATPQAQVGGEPSLNLHTVGKIKEKAHHAAETAKEKVKRVKKLEDRLADKTTFVKNSAQYLATLINTTNDIAADFVYEKILLPKGTDGKKNKAFNVGAHNRVFNQLYLTFPDVYVKQQITNDGDLSFVYITTDHDMNCFVVYHKPSKTLMVTFRGTSSIKSSIEDIKAITSSVITPENIGEGNKKSYGNMHKGFLAQQIGSFHRIVYAMKMLVEKAHKDDAKPTKDNLKLFVFGHSLGGANTTVFSYFYQYWKVQMSKVLNALYLNVPLYVISWGSPRVGTKIFARDYFKLMQGVQQTGINGKLHYIRAKTDGDLIPEVPKTVNVLKSENAYFHVGEDVNTKHQTPFQCNSRIDKVTQQLHYKKPLQCDNRFSCSTAKGMFAHTNAAYISFLTILKTATLGSGLPSGNLEYVYNNLDGTRQTGRVKGFSKHFLMSNEGYTNELVNNMASLDVSPNPGTQEDGKTRISSDTQFGTFMKGHQPSMLKKPTFKKPKLGFGSSTPRFGPKTGLGGKRRTRRKKRKRRRKRTKKKRKRRRTKKKRRRRK